MNTWWMKNYAGSAFHLYTSSLGYCPFDVSGGTLVMGSDTTWAAEDNGPVRKDGDGIIRISAFYKEEYSRREFQVAAGTVFPMTQEEWASSTIRKQPYFFFSATNSGTGAMSPSML